MSRIFFKNNPYPNGHKIEEFVWSGRLEKDRGLIFDFHLKTENYYAEDNSESEDEEINDSAWDSKIVWGNYHACIMSSSYWGDNGGVVVGSEKSKMDFNELVGKNLIIDPLPDANGHSEFAFHIYLLGHDSCANHNISFIRQYNKSTFDIEWKGNIALTYVGDYEFKHSFEATIKEAKFEGIQLDEKLSQKANEKLLKSCISENNIFKLIDNKFYLKSMTHEGFWVKIKKLLNG